MWKRLAMLTSIFVAGCPSSGPFCGDGLCGGGESCSSCSTDCGACPASCGNGACDAAESCSSCPRDCGACIPTECSATCGGCCDGDACLGGSSSSACGTGGLACVDCGPDAICMGGACYIDPASRWNIVLETLTVATTRYDGVGWDTIGGNPDPFVGIVVGSASATPILSGTANDTYSVSFTGGPTVTGARADDLGTFLGFAVFDDDSPAAEEGIGYCLVTLTGPEFGGATQTIDCGLDAATMNSGYVLTWHLERF